MFTPSEKRIILLITILLSMGLISKIFTKSSADTAQNSTGKVQKSMDSISTAPRSDAPASQNRIVQEPTNNNIPNPQNSEPLKEVNLLDINTAGKDQLISLPGIGPVLAESIVKRRKKFGPFKNTADILQVKGIGNKKLAKILPFIEIRTGK